MSQQEIVQQVRDAGVVGAGGAGFPTHVKFGARVDTVIANGAECEPMLSCDKAMMSERTGLVLDGLRLLAEATGASRVVLALKGKYAHVVQRVREVAQREAPGVEIFEMGNTYPAGDEQVLVHEVTGRVVPEGGIPLMVGAVVDNVITLSWVSQAVRAGQPVVERAITVAGEVRRPLSVMLPIGAAMRDAVQLAGGATVDDWVIVEGGPMMGRVVQDPAEPVTKKTSGVLVFERTHPVVRRMLTGMDREVSIGRAVCCQCRMCTDLCPRYLLGHELHPHLAMRAVQMGGLSDTPSAHVTAAFLCCMCNVCEAYACPLGLSPRKVFAAMLGQLQRAGVKNPHGRKDTTPHPFRGFRQAPLPRLNARLGITRYVAAPQAVDLAPAYAPAAVRIRLSQHIGAPSVPVVRAGQRVARGDLVAEIPKGQLGARQHASIDGTVAAVDAREIRIERI